MTADQFNADHQALEAWRELEKNPAWAEVQQEFDGALKASIAGLAQQGVSAEKAREHTHAYHLAEKLSTLAKTRIEQLEASVKGYAQKMARE